MIINGTFEPRPFRSGKTTYAIRRLESAVAEHPTRRHLFCTYSFRQSERWTKHLGNSVFHGAMFDRFCGEGFDGLIVIDEVGRTRSELTSPEYLRRARCWIEDQLITRLVSGAQVLLTGSFLDGWIEDPPLGLVYVPYSGGW